MLLTYEQAMNRLFERTVDNTRQLKRNTQQRRNGMEDLYGVLHTAVGDANTPATFYISISPDLVYYERFAFKLRISPFVTTIKGATDSAVVTVNSRSLSTDGSSITPNPHTHTTDAHTHNVIDGVSTVTTTSDDWTIKVAGIDVTAYLYEQHDGDPIDGEGIYPNLSNDEEEGLYDLLDVACMFDAEGDEDSRDAILKPEFKKIEVYSDAPFSAGLYLYLKYSHTNR